MRVIEVARLTRASMVFGVVFLAAERVGHFSLRMPEVAAVIVTCWLLLVSWRTGLRLWLRAQHRKGDGLLRVLIIGTGIAGGLILDGGRRLGEVQTARIILVDRALAGRAPPARLDRRPARVVARWLAGLAVAGTPVGQQA